MIFPVTQEAEILIHMKAKSIEQLGMKVCRGCNHQFIPAERKVCFVCDPLGDSFGKPFNAPGKTPLRFVDVDGKPYFNFEGNE